MRSRNFEVMRSEQAKPPAYMRRGRPVVFASESSSADGVFRCVGTSRSRVRARAPIVTELRNIPHGPPQFMAEVSNDTTEQSRRSIKRWGKGHESAFLVGIDCIYSLWVYRILCLFPDRSRAGG